MKPIFLYNYKHAVSKKQEEFYDLFKDGGTELEKIYVKEKITDDIHSGIKTGIVQSMMHKRNSLRGGSLRQDRERA